MNELKLRSLRIALILVTLIFSASAARAVTYTVDNITDNAALNICSAAANDCSLRGALNNANGAASNDVINFAPSIANMTIVLTNGQLSVANNGTLRINGALSSQVTINANNLSRVFHIQSGAFVQINSVNVTGGNAGGPGQPSTFGGGIFNNGGTLLLTNSTVYNNTAAEEGGGVHLEGGTATIINSTISGNSAVEFGGGVENFGGSVTFTNSTITGNSAGISGGGYETAHLNLGSSTTTFRNTIIANSTAGGDCVRSLGTVNAQYSLIEDGLTCVNGTNSNNLTGDPNLAAALANNGGRTLTHALQCPSIANDSGSNALALDHNNNPLDEDQRNTNAFPRIFNGTVDRGAFEIQQVCNQPPVAICQDVTVTLAPNQTTAAVSIDNGSYDPDGDPITLSQSPPGPYGPGQTVVTLTVDDGQETDSCQGTVTVQYLFKWYVPSEPLLGPPSSPWLISATAGNDVALKFSLSGYKGPNPYASPPTWQRISCITKNPLAAAQTAQISGVGTVFYNPTYDFYQTIVKTNAAWVNMCYRASIYLNDGTTQSRDYQFK